MNLIFHHDDADGIAAAAAILYAGGMDNFDEPCHCVPVDYGRPLDWSVFDDFKKDDDECWVVDFSFAPEVMEKITEVAGEKFYWIDHHKGIIDDPAYAALLARTKGVREVGPAACVLAWAMVCEAPLPIGLALIGDRDTGSHQYGDTGRQLHAYWMSEGKPGPDNFFWEHLFGYENLADLAGALVKGKRCLEYQRQVLADLINRIGVWDRYSTFAGVQVLRINHVGSSELGQIGHRLGAHLVHCWAKMPNGVLRHSLYGAADAPVNCLAIAKAHGGGGHVKAAGCETDGPGEQLAYYLGFGR